MQIKDKLQKVIDEKNNDLSKLVWKGRNRLKDDNYVQNEVRMVDCTIEELKGFYDHCDTMLYNNNKFKPGRYKLKEELSKSIDKCNTELAKRFLLDSGFPEFKMIPLLNRFEDDQTLFDLINEGDSIPYEFKDVTIGSLKEAMLDKLGIFNKKPLTITFIVKQGIWLTPEESEKFKGKNKMKQIKEALNFKPNSRIKLKVNPKGLSFEEMKSLLELRSDKYSNYTDLQLELLRDKMLFILMKDVDRHISEWEERQQNILRVIEFKKKVDRTLRQKQGIKKWINHDMQGTLQYCTGFGKTTVALMCIKLLHMNNPLLRVLIGVPTLRLQEQWILKLEEKKLPGEVYVINTLSKLEPQPCDLLILDEIHRCASDTFSKVFDNIQYKHILGLTATFERLDGRHNSILKRFAPVVDVIPLEMALENEWISDYVEYKVFIEPDDIDYYKDINREFLDAFSYFGNDFKIAMACATDWKARNKYTASIMNTYDKSKFSEQNKLTLIKATTFTRCLKKRKEYIYNHPDKIRIAQMILDARKDRKCITFSSRVKGARAIKRGLVLSSHAKPKEQREIMEEFIPSKTGVLNTCSMLDEGADIPHLSVAVILGFTSSKTSKTQRIGRVVRKEGDKMAEIFTLVIKDTVDEQWFSNSNTSEYVTIDEEQLKNVLEGKPFRAKTNTKTGFKIRF